MYVGLTFIFNQISTLMCLLGTIMCSDTECLEVLIVLHICSFLMSNDSGNMSLGDIETIVSYNQSIEISRDLSLDKFDF